MTYNFVSKYTFPFCVQKTKLICFPFLLCSVEYNSKEAAHILWQKKYVLLNSLQISPDPSILLGLPSKTIETSSIYLVAKISIYHDYTVYTTVDVPYLGLIP